MTSAELLQARLDAGAAYASAATAMANAYVELLGCELAARNMNVRALPPSFTPMGEMTIPLHSQFLQSAEKPHQINARARTRAEQLIAGITG